VDGRWFGLVSFVCRILRSVTALAAVAASLLIVAVAQNPVPQIVGPVKPTALVPGSSEFTLTVYGANFVPGAVVNWNRQPRLTTFISARELKAQILASDVATATAGYITVTNPAPGGGFSSSSWSLVEVHTPTATIAPGNPIPYRYGLATVPSLLAADFTNDGILDLAAGLANRTINVSLGKGNATFKSVSNATYVYNAGLFGLESTAYGDFNNDGKLDLLCATDTDPAEQTLGLSVSLGNGDGTFDSGWRYLDRATGKIVDFVVGDFNRDGNLDFAGGDCCINYVFLGNGDGTFQLTTSYPDVWGGNIQVGDFNGDGILDLAIEGIAYANGKETFPIAIAFGNGDGTFQPTVMIANAGGGCAFGQTMLVSDFNGDGNLDIAFCNDTSIGILLGNGNGTFQGPTYYTVSSTGTGAFTFAAGDFNSDGKTDLIVSSDIEVNGSGQFWILLGNGDGTFQTPSLVKVPGTFATGELGIVTGDFNSDGLLDFIFQLGGFGFNVYPQQQE
jgi:hypothetical protein